MDCCQSFDRKEVYRYRQGEWILTEFDGEWLHYDGEVLIGSPTNGWVTESGIQSPQYSAVKGGMLVENGSLYKFNGSTAFVTNFNTECDKRVFATHPGMHDQMMRLSVVLIMGL